MKPLHKKLLPILLTFTILFSLLAISPAMEISARAVSEPANKKACWIAFLDIEVLLKDKNEQDFRDKVAAMYDNVARYGMNTVIVHVRALGDAMYPSDYYPWAEYFTTDRRDPGYDPLQIMLDLAHQKNLQFEAWINPYRLSRDSKSTLSFKATPYYEQFRPFLIEYKSSGGQTCLVLDPAKQETLDLVTNGVKEIVSRYDVDGIHFDDYFYVPGMADNVDTATRKANVNVLISQVYQTIKSIKPDCSFGISPAGNIESARNQGADVDTWLSTPGYVDYLMPQIYWTDVYVTKKGSERMFTNRCSAWQPVNKLDLPLYVGLAVYRAGEKSKTDLGWSTSDNNLAYQYLTAKQFGYDGYSLFRYAWLEKDIAAAELNHLRIY